MQLELITRSPISTPHPTPILFLHGMWHGAWCWDEYFLPYFAQHNYRVYALSFRGHGNSAGRDKVLLNRASDYVADVTQIAEQITNETGQAPILVGHSLGGYVVQKYLENHLAPAAILLASVPTHGSLMFLLRVMLRHPLPYFKVFLTFNCYYLIGTPALTHDSLFSDSMPSDQVATYFSRMVPDSFIAGFESVINLPRPGKVKTPVLVLGGKEDRVFINTEVQQTAQAYHIQAELFPNMAHDMMLEKDWQLVADRMIAWLGERGL